MLNKNADDVVSLLGHIEKGEEIHSEALKSLKYFYIIPREFIKKWNEYAAKARRVVSPRATKGNIEQLETLLTYIPDSDKEEIYAQDREAKAADDAYYNGLMKELEDRNKEYQRILDANNDGCSVLLFVILSALGALTFL